MSTLQGKFETRREAEMAVERLVQEHDIDRKAIQIAPEGAKNSAGEEAGGSDAGAGQASSAGDDAALEGRIVVSVDVSDDEASKVREAFQEFSADA
jgi:hypothetical protein